ncbi:hypothetical protein [Candidatus Hodarchaeum mangrovi]
MLERIEQEFFLLYPEKYVKMVKNIVEKYNKTAHKDFHRKNHRLVTPNPHKTNPKCEIVYFHLLRFF